MDFNNGNFFGGGEPNKRDRLEIGNDGKSTAENKKERQEEQQRNFMEMGNNSGYGGKGGGLKNRVRGRFGRKGNNSRYGNNRSGGFISVLVGLAFIAIPIVIVVLLFTGNLTGWMRSFMSTPEQNTTELMQGFYDSQNMLRDTYLTDEEREQVAVYRKNEIGRVEFIDEQVYPEYVVYVYSDSESKNEEFTNFVLEAEESGFPVPIFRISADLTKDYFITDTAGVNEPALLIYRNNTGEVEYDSMITDSEHFGKLSEYMREIIKEDDEYFKNSKGSYGESEILNRLGGEEQEESTTGTD